MRTAVLAAIIAFTARPPGGGVARTLLRSAGSQAMRWLDRRRDARDAADSLEERPHRG
jgi:hypothetical protein